MSHSGPAQAVRVSGVLGPVLYAGALIFPGTTSGTTSDTRYGPSPGDDERLEKHPEEHPHTGRGFVANADMGPDGLKHRPSRTFDQEGNATWSEPDSRPTNARDPGVSVWTKAAQRAHASVAAG